MVSKGDHEGLGKIVNCVAGKKWLDSECILRVNLILGFGSEL